MTKLVWQPPSSKPYESGVDRGVLYPTTGSGVAWNGLTNAEIGAVGGDVEPLYFDGIKYMDFVANRDFTGKITAASAPEEFGPCVGEVSPIRGFVLTRQPKQTFGLCYRTMISDLGYKLHIVYNASANQDGRSYKTLSDQNDPTAYTWNINATPVSVTNKRPSAHFVVDSRKTNSTKLATLEGLLYGTSGTAPALPSVATLISTLT